MIRKYPCNYCSKRPIEGEDVINLARIIRYNIIVWINVFFKFVRNSSEQYFKT